MAEKLGSAVLELSTDSTGLEKGLKSAKAGTDKLIKQFSNVGKKMSLFVTLPIAGIGVAAVKSAADMEMLQASFETMLGSAEDAASLLAELEAFAASTPFQLTDLAEGTKTLLAFGISAEEALPAMRQLGDIAQGDSNKLQSLTLAFAQIQSTGRLMGQDLLQLINAGFNPLQVIGEQTGETMAELKDRMSAGGISAEEVADAFKTATSEGGRFFGGMERASGTLNGLISTFKDNVAALGREFGKVLLPILKDAVVRLTALVQWFGSMDDRTKKLILTVLGVAAAVGPVLIAFSKVVKAIQAIGIAIKVIGGLFNLATAASPVGLVMAAIAAVAAAVFLIIKNWDKIKEFFKKLWARVKEIFFAAVNAVKEFLQKHWMDILGVLTGPIGIAVVQIIKHWDEIKAVFDRAAQFILGILQRLTDGIREFLIGRFEGIVEGVGNTVDKITGFFQGMFESVVGGSIVPEMVDGVSAEFERMGENMVTSTMTAAQKVQQTLGNISQVVGMIGTAWQQAFKNQEIAIDNDYKKRKAAIENNVTDEAERDRQLEQLDKQFAEKKNALRKKEARAAKAQALIEAIVNTASAVVQALPNIPLSIAVGILGAVQIGLIAAQPIPQFQTGADFEVPPGFENDDFLFGAQTGERVQVTPEEEVAAGEGGAGQPMHVTINLDGQPIADFITEASRDRRFIIDAEAVQ